MAESIDYEVQRILDVREKDGVKLYLVQWKGFG